VPKCFGQILSRGGPVSMVDAVVLKKYPLYFKETAVNGSARKDKF
jgi:hypothetical protein